MDFKYIEAFLMVIQKGSFSSAAEELYITQPTLSNRIQKLEQELNVKLFQRGGGEKAVLTDDGKKLLPFYKRGYQLIQEGNELFNLHYKLDKQIIISSPNHLGASIIPKILEGIQSAYPNINFLLEINESPTTLNNVSKGQADIGLIYTTSNKEFENLEHIEIHPVAKEEIILVCSPQHPLTRLNQVSIENIREEYIIRSNKTFKSAKEVDKYFRLHGISNYKTIEIKNLEWLKEMVKNQSGIAFLLQNIVNNDIKEGKLYKLPLQHNLPIITLALVFRKDMDTNIKKLVFQKTKKLFKSN